MDTKSIFDEDWEHVLSLMPEGFESSCYDKLALRRRREVQSAGDLLRLCLAYSLCDMSLRETAAWASATGVAEMSDVAVLKRLRGAEQWLGHLVMAWLAERGMAQPEAVGAVRVIDATALCGPGATGIEHRVHLRLDLATQRIADVQLTDVKGGETLKRHRIAKGEIVLADRGYAHAKGIAGALRSGGHVVVRVGWQNVPLATARGRRRIEITRLLSALPSDAVGDWAVRLVDAPGAPSLRLIALRKSRAAAERARRRVMREAKRKGRRADARSLRAAEYILVLTDLSAETHSALSVLELYRLRWQIERTFKRLKGLLDLSKLRARQPALARTYIFTKLLAALVLQELWGRALAFFPWGFPLPEPAAQHLASHRAVGRRAARGGHRRA